MAPSDTQDWDAPNEAIDQSASNHNNAPGASPQNGQDEAQKRASVGENATGGAEASERPAKKMKRGKYISRACVKEEIHADNASPKNFLVSHQAQEADSKDNKDSATREQNLVGVKTRLVAPRMTDKLVASQLSINREVLNRLEAVERHLRLMRPPSPDPARSTSNRPSTDDQLRPPGVKLQNALETDGQTFAGEMTMTPTSDDENDRLDNNGSVSSAMHVDYSSPASSLLPPVTSICDVRGRKRGWLESLLERHGINTDEEQCRYQLQVYMDEVHPMYPIIHPPAIWEVFNEMWLYPAPSSFNESVQSERVRLSLALVCFCLALGRCSMSARMSDPSGVDSSGWSLHNVGMSLLGDLLETSNTAIKSLLMLQVLMVRVIYLFRLDANQKAARVHAVAVSIAQTIGLHRQKTIEGMPAYYNQLYSRTWWSLYLLDRRLALESGKPYLIQDSNVDTPLPKDLSDEWMTQYASKKCTMVELEHETAAEIARDSSPSCVPYVVAMVRYCRVAGKTWEVLYGVKASTASMSAMIEYVDTAMDKLLSTVPISLQYDSDVPYEAQFRTRPRWQVKQTFLFNNCCTYLRLLIRRPLLPSPNTIYHTEEDDLESSMECASLAARILTTHQSIRDDGIKYSFALSHYVTSCAMVMVGLVSREPGSKRRYGGLILAATQCLNVYCQKIWVSGKMMRCVSRLSRLVERVLGLDSQNHQSPTNMRRESVSEHITQHLTPPQNEDQDPGQMRQRAGTVTSETFANQLKDRAMAHRGSIQQGQGADYYPFNNDSLNTMTGRPPLSLTKLPTSWMAEPGINGQNNWIMSDFVFETFGDRFGSNDADFSTFSGNDGLDFDPGMTLNPDRETGELRLGVNGVFDLDVDLIPTMANLYAA